MKMNSKKGFTLIELLVVVAIIAVLTSVVLALLTTARNKGRDSSIKTQMKALQNQVELDFVGGNYNGVFTGNNQWASTDTKIQAILTGIDKQMKIHTAGSGTSAWMAQAQLATDATKYFCVDTSGKGTTSTTVLSAGATVCP